ncbi:hypothetical protein ACNJYA_08985 [Bradyrhizobium sp. DASA03068]|uniref:hypothetical protein n=1 Tax=Bradyrhizobium sp. BLXBL-01 TaxID=3395915 RepID=UPI003F719302
MQVLGTRQEKQKTSTLKALLDLTEGFMTGEVVLFAGPGALERAEATNALGADEIRWHSMRQSSVHKESSPRYWTQLHSGAQ